MTKVADYRGILKVWYIFCLMGLMALPSSASAAKAYKEVMELFVGQTQLLSYKNVKRIAVGNGKLVNAKVLNDSGQILLIANGEGVTDLRIWLRNGKSDSFLLRILKKPPDEIFAQVQARLKGIEGINIRMSGEQVIVDGYSLRDGDYKRVKAVADQFPEVINNVSGGGLTLKSMILLDVKVLEVNKKDMNQIGVEWDSLLNNTIQFDPRQALKADFGVTSNLGAKINLLTQNGAGKLLAEPKLVSVSGGKAEFHVGGEVPIPITNNDGSTNVIFKQYGIILNMNPTADREGYISSNVEVEVSTIDANTTVSGFPAFLTRRTNTTVNVQQGETIVLSGLLSSESSKDVKKVPGLGHVPILGELFKSRGFEDKQTDLVIFVTPSIIDAQSDKNKSMLEKREQLSESADESLRFDILD
ncbi:MAG: hypothetical protein HON94_13450 [Methylococcales bacterium]|jgi:pilus assembly protein CpaC|nr:hypothetical protein [Methylococcales bacterium]MBT7409102.1 hypothetical protein [Methylococcales bacterium]